MRSFTDDITHRAVPVERLPAHALADLETVLGVSGLAAVAGSLSNREHVKKRLERLPASALAVLEALCESNGRTTEALLRARLSERLGRGELADAAVRLLRFEGFLVGVQPAGTVALVAPSAELIARLVVGVTHPEPLADEVPEDPERLAHERRVLAVVTLAAHRKLRFTRDGAPNRTSLRSFAKGLVASEDEVEALLVRAMRAGLLTDTDDRTLPSVHRLREQAENGLVPGDPGSLLGRLDAALPLGTLVPVLALAALLQPFGVDPSEKALARLCSEVATVREHRGRSYAGRPPRPRALTGDGHVAPNLEVLLGPGAHPSIVAEVGLFAELMRLDRVLTFRLTASSVASGIALGGTVEEMLATLSRVGRHAVPENVAITVRDFALRVARIRPVWAVEVPAASTDAVLQRLGPGVWRSPSPGLLIGPAGIPQPEVEAAVASAGLRALVDADRSYTVQPRRHVVSLPEPDRALRDAVQRDAKQGFAESARADARTTINFSIGPDRDAVEVVRRAREKLAAASAPTLLLRDLTELEETLRGVPEEIRAWAKRLPQAARATAMDAALSPLALLPYAIFEPADRRRFLQRSTSWEALHRLVGNALGLTAHRPPRYPLLAAFLPDAQLARPLAAAAWPGDARDDEDVHVEVARVPRGPGLFPELQYCVECAEPLGICVRGPDGALAEYEVVATGFRDRGTQRVLLCEDLETEEAYAFPLDRIEWIEVEVDPEPDDDADAAGGAPTAPSWALEKLAQRWEPGMPVPAGRKVGRNEPCPCGSGRKYKRCHGVGAEVL